ncbi:hypothetical protein DEO72_LG7g1264 [Vigna unguiculata]|uniref:Uncharacterized protein n=1 Tax=Vigna unguiculata TaxID=3917 RepID=A0A4D6MG39_VIGUN|nr:hypothetical protein DEO72_LG7g1264 [Vigna unguiculata]
MAAATLATNLAAGHRDAPTATSPPQQLRAPPPSSSIRAVISINHHEHRASILFRVSHRARVPAPPFSPPPRICTLRHHCFPSSQQLCTPETAPQFRHHRSHCNRAQSPPASQI